MGRDVSREAGPRGNGGLAAVLALLCMAGAAAGAAAAVQWHDVTAQAGIVFRTAGEVHDPDYPDQGPAIAELLGPGACWLDHDGDGYQDLYLVNQVYNLYNPAVDAAWATPADPHNQLYRNEGDGTFTDVSAAAGVDSRAWGMGCSAADYDGDGWLDLFVANYGDNELFRNNGDGTFTNATAEAGVAMQGACGEFTCFSTGSAWADYDADGDLDLYVGNYIGTDLLDDDYNPTTHSAQANWLFRNDGDGTFTEVAMQAGAAGDLGEADGSKTLSVVWFDADLDGDPDLYVCNDSTSNDYLVNLGDGTFEDRSLAAGLADAHATIACASADYDQDGMPDLFLVQYYEQHHGLYRNRGDGTFEDRTGEDGLATAWALTGYGAAWLDAERDGDLDLLVVNGGPFPELEDYEQPASLYLQEPEAEAQAAAPGDVHWRDATPTAGPALARERVGRGAAFADLDHDGDTDVAVLNNANDTAELWRAEGVEGGWLTVQLLQPGMNRHAIGARVEVDAQGRAQMQEVRAGSGYLSQDALDLSFGLGAAPSADRVTVHWPLPFGGTSVFHDVAAGQLVRAEPGLPGLVNDTLSPRTTLHLHGPEGLAGWHTGPIEATFNATDQGVSWRSGVARTEAARGQDAWKVVDAGDGWHFAADGIHALRWRSHDVAGNVEPVRRDEVRIDATPPRLSHTLEGVAGEAGWWVQQPVQVTLEAEDATSGVAAVRYRLGEGDWQDYTAPFLLEDDGVHLVTYEAEDHAGNPVAPRSFEVRVDRTPPTVVLHRPRDGEVWVGGTRLAAIGVGPAMLAAPPDAMQPDDGGFEVRAVASDGASGVTGLTFRVDGQMRHTADPGEARGEAGALWHWPLRVEPAGRHTVAVEVRDAASNTAVATVEVVVVPAAREARPGTGPGT